MLTVGIDLAAQPKKTALCELSWTGQAVEVTELAIGVTDDAIASSTAPAVRVAVDVPFGWPRDFVETVSLHAAQSVASGDSPPSALDLRWRSTDRFVFEQTGLRPLSVSTDKIGVAALRWVGIERMLRSRGHVVDRTGSGKFLEAYPAAALLTWGLPHRTYKGARRRSELGILVDELTGRGAMLDLASFEEAIRWNDDAFDALICALVAGAAERGLTHEAPHDELVESEGWIHLPRAGSLDELVG